MTVDHTTDNGLLCLGGGTGIAPIKALVEDVAEHGERRPVEVFYGARSDHDLYDIDTMLRLQQTHPWLVGPPGRRRAGCIGSSRTPCGEYGPWNEYDAYLSGPARHDPQRRGRAARHRHPVGPDTPRLGEELVARPAAPTSSGQDQPRSGACIARTPSMLPSR